jgi:hypothetical protein
MLPGYIYFNPWVEISYRLNWGETQATLADTNSHSDQRHPLATGDGCQWGAYRRIYAPWATGYIFSNVSQ